VYMLVLTSRRSWIYPIRKYASWRDERNKEKRERKWLMY